MNKIIVYILITVIWCFFLAGFALIALGANFMYESLVNQSYLYGLYSFCCFITGGLWSAVTYKVSIEYSPLKQKASE